MGYQHTAGKCSLIGIALLLCLAAPVFSQQPPGAPPIDRTTNSERVRQQDMSRREYQLRNFGNQPVGTPNRKQLAALMAQTEEDFNRILVLHNEIARAISSAKALDYHFVSDATGEIRKRAIRLQSTLALHQSPTEAQISEKSEAFNDSQINSALVKLCKQIKSFVTNPIIETPNTVNAEQLTNARRDLERLIQLSGHIKKDVDKLSKTRK
jgi:hypothetical protein